MSDSTGYVRGNSTNEEVRVTAAIPINVRSLSDIGKKIAKDMSDHDRGPLIVAREIVSLAENWEQYQDEAEGKSCSQWLISIGTGGRRDVAWFTRRAEAVEAMGEHARRTWNHEALVWATNQFSDPLTLRRLDREVLAVSRANGNGALSKMQVAAIAKKIGLVADQKRKRVCGRCQALAAALQAAGLPVPA